MIVCITKIFLRQDVNNTPAEQIFILLAHIARNVRIKPARQVEGINRMK
jgi:hypothetical protein